MSGGGKIILAIVIIVGVVLYLLWKFLFRKNPVKAVEVNERDVVALEKKSLLISFAAYFATEWLGDRDFIETHTKETLGAFLQREDIAELVTPSEEGEKKDESKAYELIWGPACFQSSASMIADNTMYVAREISDHSKLFIGVAGTHPLSLFSWLFQDFDVFNLVEWPYARRTEDFFRIISSPDVPHEDPHDEPRQSVVSAHAAEALDVSESEDDKKLMICKGTFRALKTLVAMQDPETKLTLVRFLAEQCEAFHKEHLNDPEAKMDITVTGHSLGGALCHALALYLHDNVSVWDEHGRARLLCVSFAGPTMGNRLLARYYDACLGATSYRVANSYDIVPLAWDTEYMSSMYQIYEPYISTPWSFEILLQIFISAIAPKHYAHVCDKQKFFCGPQPNSKNDWTPEMMAQHSKSYFTHYNLNNLATHISEHAPIFREAFCDGTFTSSSMKAVYGMVADKVKRKAEGTKGAKQSVDPSEALEDNEKADVEVVADDDHETKQTFASSVLLYANMLKDNLINASDVVKDSVVSLGSSLQKKIQANDQIPEEAVEQSVAN